VKIHWDKYQGDIWMRIINRMLVTGVIFFFSAASASAISFTLAGANGQDVVANDQVSVTVSMDTEGLTGITLLSIGVLFDDTRLSYNQAASSTSSYILYSSTAKNGGQYLSAAARAAAGALERWLARPGPDAGRRDDDQPIQGVGGFSAESSECTWAPGNVRAASRQREPSPAEN